MYSSFIAATLAEIACLGAYYPFDLIKTRMQTSNQTYKYNSVLDAFFKIGKESTYTGDSAIMK